MLLDNPGRMRGRARELLEYRSRLLEWAEIDLWEQRGNSKREVLGQEMFWDKFPYASLARAYNLLCSWASDCLELGFSSLNNCGLHYEQCIVPL